VTAADPLGSASARAALGSGVDVTDSLADAIRSCDVVVVTTPWPAIRDVASQAWTRPGAPLIVIDPWCLLQGSPVADLATVISLGRGGYRAASGKEAVSEVAARR
jgi:predicted dinucleotide-binding enzyme